MRASPAWTLLLVVAIIACGGSSAPKETAPTPEPGGIPAGIDPRLAVAGEMNVKATYPEPIDLVWKALAVAYDSVGIKLGILDPKLHLMGNQGLSMRRRLGTTMLSKYIECGSAQIGLSADNYEVIMSVISHVRVTEAGATEVVTRVSSAARPPTVGQTYSRCSSKGELEQRLGAFVKATLARSR